MTEFINVSAAQFVSIVTDIRFTTTEDYVQAFWRFYDKPLTVFDLGEKPHLAERFAICLSLRHLQATAYACDMVENNDVNNETGPKLLAEFISQFGDSFEVAARH